MTAVVSHGIWNGYGKCCLYVKWKEPFVFIFTVKMDTRMVLYKRIFSTP
jgi:hypothetical protein